MPQAFLVDEEVHLSSTAHPAEGAETHGSHGNAALKAYMRKAKKASKAAGDDERNSEVSETPVGAPPLEDDDVTPSAPQELDLYHGHHQSAV